MKFETNIARFERHFKNAMSLMNRDLADYLVYNTIAMECFQAVNALIEIGEYILTNKNLGFPSTYREIFDLLFKSKLLTENEFRTIKRLIFLRNLIAHEYYRITEDELREMAGLLEKANSFVERIKRGYK